MELHRFFKIHLANKTGDIVYDIDGTTPGKGITSGSMDLEEILCENELEIGAYNSNKFEVQLYGLDKDVTGFWITVTNIYDPNNPEPLFKGIVDSAETDNKNGYRDIVAYDQMYEARNKDIGPDWENFWASTTSATLRTLREAICGYAGFNVGLINPLPNDNLLFVNTNLQLSAQEEEAGIEVPHFTSIKFGTLLKMMCELQGTCPNVDREGNLEFIILGTTSTAFAKDLDNVYNKNDATFQDYVTQAPTGFSVYSSSSELSQMVPSDRSINTNPYPISGNVLLLNMTSEQVTTTLNRVRLNIQNMVYMPATVPMIASDLSLKLGDMISTTQRGVTTYHFILSQSFSGSLLVDQTIDSPAYGEYLNNVASSVNDTIVEGVKYSKVLQEIDRVMSEVGDLDEGLTRLEQTAEGLAVDIATTDGRVTQINATIDGLTVTDEHGTTVIDGSKVQTDNLYVTRIWSRDGSPDSIAEMHDAGLRVSLGQTSAIYLGYANPSGSSNKFPYMQFTAQSGTSQINISGLVKRYSNGIWLGDDADLNSGSIQAGTGIFINFTDNKIYKYVRGTAYTIADDQTLIATFG